MTVLLLVGNRKWLSTYVYCDGLLLSRPGTVAGYLQQPEDTPKAHVSILHMLLCARANM